MDLKGIMRNEMLEGERQILHILTHMWILKNVKLLETESRMVVVKAWWVGGMGRCWTKHTKFQLEDVSSEDIEYSMVTKINSTVLYAGKLLRE